MRCNSFARGVPLALTLSTLALLACSSDEEDASLVDAPPADDGAAAEDFDAVFTELDCLELTSAEALEVLPLGDPSVSCGRVRVPASWAVPDGDTIDLAVYRIAATTDAPAPDPTVILAGGPGQAAVSELGGLVDGPGTFLRERADVIVVDQRGTGFSTPSLVCPAFVALDEGDVDGPELDTTEGQVAASREAMAACVDRLVGEGVVLADYTTANNVRDIDAVRAALGIERWNLFGGSYGTTLALAMLRDRPEGVRSAVLDSVAPLQMSLLAPAEVAYARGYWPLSQIVTNCAADADCSANVGDIRVPIEDGVARLDSAPVGVLTAEVYIATVLTRFIAEPVLPSIVETIATGSDEEVLALIGTPGAGEGDEQPSALEVPAGLLPLFDADVMYAGVVCAEEVPYADSIASPDLADDFRQTTRDVIEREALNVVFDTEFCDRLGVPAAEPIASRAVASDVPALVIAGDTDVQTPPAWSELAAETLSRSQYVELPGAGHVSTADGFPCTAELVGAFLDDPEAAVDRSCADALPLVDYVTEPSLAGL